MKTKKLTFLFIILLFAFYSKAQIVVDCVNERVGIGFDVTNPSKDVHIKAQMRFEPRNNVYFDLNASMYGWVLKPSHDGSGFLGYVNKLYAVHAETIWGDNLTSSDVKLKNNIVPLNKALPLINKLRPVSFDYKRDRSKVENAKIKSELEANDKNRMGFIAQEVKEVLPQSVIERSMDSTLSIRMDDLIPLLVKGMQEQQAQIDSLVSVINKLNKPDDLIKSAQIGGVDVNSNSEAKLEQNNPNPFSEQTTINCFIPTNSNNARLLVFNMQGTLVKTLNVPGRNKTSVTIAGAELNAGMYIYSLVIDNKEIDSKRMILSN